MQFTTLLDDTLVLNAELTAAQVRAVQRRVKAGELSQVVRGLSSSLPAKEWPALVARNLTRVLAAFLPGTVVGYRTALEGGRPYRGVVQLVGTYRRKLALPGLRVEVWPGPPPQATDVRMSGRELFFPSEERALLENLLPSRGQDARTVGAKGVEERLLSICESRGETALSALRERARALASALDLAAEFTVLDGLVGSILNTRPSTLTTARGKAIRATPPYDSERLELFESLAATLRAQPLPMPATVAVTLEARRNFSFLESYFSNFIEGTEFEVSEARGFVLEGVPIDHRPKDSHDIVGVYEQSISPLWSTLTLPAGEPVLAQLQARHRLQMERRLEAGPGEFKLRKNQAGNTGFVGPQLVRGTLEEGSKLLPTVPAGTARALLAMFLIAEVHPFDDGNGRLARLAMNAELTAVDGCRIIVPTLYRETYLDCLRLLTREGRAEPYLKAMAHIHDWTSRFDYTDLDKVIADMKACNAFERSLGQYRLSMPERAPA